MNHQRINPQNQHKHNFGAGPCILPQTVIEQAAEGVRSLPHGLSVLEISHRSPEFEAILQEIEKLVRKLLDVPDNYSVLFLQGGASMQFTMIAMNFLQGSSKTAAYLDCGYFGSKAKKEARLFGQVDVVANGLDYNYTLIPKDYEIPKDAAYFHYTSNNTIEGTQHQETPQTSVPLICDMSSDIFTKPVDVSQYALIYAGAQKNMGPAGMTLVIIKDEFLHTIYHELPAMLDYRAYKANHSLYNTPPVFAIYTAMLNLRWIIAQGGVKAMEENSITRSSLLYREIDNNPLFYGLADKADRSRMNVTFKMHDSELEADFLAYATKQGMVGIAGYRTVGGFRVSMYNALPVASVIALTECMASYTRSQLKHLELAG